MFSLDSNSVWGSLQEEPSGFPRVEGPALPSSIWSCTAASCSRTASSLGSTPSRRPSAARSPRHNGHLARTSVSARMHSLHAEKLCWALTVPSSQVFSIKTQGTAHVSHIVPVPEVST